MNNNRFFKIVPFYIQYIYFTEFYSSGGTAKNFLLIWSFHISFNVPNVFKAYPWDSFSAKETKHFTFQEAWWMRKVLHFHNPVLREKIHFKKYSGIVIRYHYNYVSKLATLVVGDPKAPFSIAATPSCRGGRYSFSWIAPLYPWFVPYNAAC